MRQSAKPTPSPRPVAGTKIQKRFLARLKRKPNALSLNTLSALAYSTSHSDEVLRALTERPLGLC
jgi:hypothetical protein